MSDPRDNWERTYDHSVPSDFNRVRYSAGAWVAAGQITDGLGPLVAVSTDGALTWTALSLDDVNAPVWDIAYGDGQWAILAGTSAYSSSSPASSWTVETQPHTEPRGLDYGDGHWVIVDVAGRVETATELGSWTTGEDLRATLNGLLAYDVATGSGAVDVRFVGDAWLVVVSFVQLTTGYEGFAIFSATDPTSTWTSEEVVIPASGVEPLPASIGYTGTEYFVHIGALLYTASALGAGWTLRSSDEVRGRNGGFFAYGDGDWVSTPLVGSAAEVAVATSADGPFVVESSLEGSEESVFPSDGAFADTWVVVGRLVDSGAIWTATGGGEGWGLLL